MYDLKVGNVCLCFKVGENDIVRINMRSSDVCNFARRMAPVKRVLVVAEWWQAAES